MKTKSFLVLFCLACISLLLVVYIKLPEDYQGKTEDAQEEKKTMTGQLTYRRSLGKMVQDLLRLPNVSVHHKDFEIKFESRLNNINNKISNNEHLLLEIGTLLKKSLQNQEQISETISSQQKTMNRIEGPCKDKNPIPSTTTISKSLNNNDPMYKIHMSVYNKMTDKEIQEFYNRERISSQRYGQRTLDPVKDRQLLMGLFPGPDESRDRVTDQLNVKLDVTEYKTIYVARSGVNTQRKFENDKCNVNKCRITSDPKQSATADIVYIENRMQSRYLQNNQNRNQVTVVFQLESARNYPTIVDPQIRSGAHLRTLNWTASYRADSVLNTPYERFTPYINATWLALKPSENYARGKTKMATWFVSNCGAPSGRSNYVKELQKYISVDIYGRCGKPCSKRQKRCFEQLNTDYKFYLSFENTNCKDYITEKVYWNGLS